MVAEATRRRIAAVKSMPLILVALIYVIWPFVLENDDVERTTHLTELFGGLAASSRACINTHGLRASSIDVRYLPDQAVHSVQGPIYKFGDLTVLEGGIKTAVNSIMYRPPRLNCH